MPGVDLWAKWLCKQILFAWIACCILESHVQLKLPIILYGTIHVICNLLRVYVKDWRRIKA